MYTIIFILKVKLSLFLSLSPQNIYICIFIKNYYKNLKRMIEREREKKVQKMINKFRNRILSIKVFQVEKYK